MTGRLFSVTDSITLNYGQTVTRTYRVIPEITGRGLLRGVELMSQQSWPQLLYLYPQSNNLSDVSRVILTVDGNEMEVPLLTFLQEQSTYFTRERLLSRVPIPFSSSLSLDLILLAGQSSVSTVTLSFNFTALVYLLA